MYKDYKELNPIAREAFARSGIDVGVAIFKSILLIILVLPISLIAKIVFEGGKVQWSIEAIFSSISPSGWLLFSALILVGLITATYFRDTGVKILHEMEEDEV
jgi:hypothetical protein